ncbi:Prefoldin subunit-domain-containing protein [Hyaloraphidium curvatum]|nr:Prefoldin subunit-domain-containing protein [Hyaloraphidium curvatum]
METNPRGIPRAPFVAKVEDFLTGSDAETTLDKFSEMRSKYAFMEDQLLRKRRSLQEKIPELEKTLEAVKFFVSKQGEEEPIKVRFELNDTLWANARIPPGDKVCLWLGANIMVQYSTDEAATLLSDKLSSAKTNLTYTLEDLEFLKEQITTMEVNIARVYNYDVKQRRGKEAGE